MRAYGMTFTDTNIDHRRVGSMLVFFQRHAMTLSNDAKDRDQFRPGDILFYAWSWMRGSPAEHVAVVSDRRGPSGNYMLIQNGGPKPIENDGLAHGKIVGHFRALPGQQR